MSKARLEAFSDGVIAIAITLLVLDLKVPPVGAGSLGHQLAEQWPGYVAYVVSFLTIGIIWINHHVMIGRLRVVDHTILLLNLLLLLCIGFLPFSTALLAEYLRDSRGEHLAAAVYAGSFLLMSIAFYSLQRETIVNRKYRLSDSARGSDLRRIKRRSRTGLLPYLIATAVAPLSAYLTLGICAAIAIFYALPQPAELLGEAEQAGD